MKTSMNMAKQGGFSGICFFSTLLVVLMVVFASTKMMPVYLADRTVQKSLEEMTKTAGLHNSSTERLMSILKTTVNRNARLKSDELNIDKIGYVVTRSGIKIVGVNYEVVVPVLFNLSLLATFKHEVEIRPYTGKKI